MDHGVGGGERTEGARHLFADLGVAEAILALHLPDPPAHDRVRVGEGLRRALPAQRRLFEPAGKQHHLLAALHDFQRGRELREALEQGEHLLAIDGLLRALEADLHRAHRVGDGVARLVGRRIGHGRAHLTQVVGEAQRVRAPVELQHSERLDGTGELRAVGREGEQQAHAVVRGERGHGSEVGRSQTIDELQGGHPRANETIDAAEREVEEKEELTSGRRRVARLLRQQFRGVDLAQTDELHPASVVGDVEVVDGQAGHR